MPLLDTFKSEQQSFERILPREAALDAHPQRMDGFVEEAFTSTLGGFGSVVMRNYFASVSPSLLCTPVLASKRLLLVVSCHVL